MIAFPSREAQAKSWKEFGADPDWQAAFKASEEKGKLVTKAESVFLNATDFSPAIKPSAAAPRVFELRTYTTTPGNLGRLQARFRDHTVALFQKHGMTNLFYWIPMADQKTADNTLVYSSHTRAPTLQRHRSRRSAAIRSGSRQRKQARRTPADRSPCPMA